MVILGIDPGSRRIGYGLIEKNRGELTFLRAGLLRISPGDGFSALREVKKQTEDLLDLEKPGIVAVEKLYFSRNQKTGLEVAQSRGVIMAAAIERNLTIREFSPSEIKAGLTGYGFADKKAVLKMVRAILSMPDLNVIDDASDALAIAILAAQRIRFARGGGVREGLTP